MKKLYILRHAKSSWDSAAEADFDRPLNERGKIDAVKMGDKLKVLGIKPDYIICSPAKRAYKTAKRIARQLNFDVEKIIQEAKIYEASVTVLLKIIKSLPNQFQEILLVGHNPGLTELVNKLGAYQVDELPTCAVYGLAFEISEWSKLEKENSRFLVFDYPKNI